MTDKRREHLSRGDAFQRRAQDDVFGLGVGSQTEPYSVERSANLLDRYGPQELVQTNFEIVMIAAQQRQEIGHGLRIVQRQCRDGALL